KDFPRSIVLHIAAGAVELGRGPFAYRPDVARAHYETALSLAEQSTRPEDADMIPRIKEALSVMNETNSRLPRFAFGGTGVPFGSGAYPNLDDVINFFTGGAAASENDDFDPPSTSDLPSASSAARKPRRKPRTK